MVICNKVRKGDERIITIKDTPNYPLDAAAAKKCMEHVLIVDDLVQSGGTLIECAKALQAQVTEPWTPT